MNPYLWLCNLLHTTLAVFLNIGMTIYKKFLASTVNSTELSKTYDNKKTSDAALTGLVF